MTQFAQLRHVNNLLYRSSTGLGYRLSKQRRVWTRRAEVSPGSNTVRLSASAWSDHVGSHIKLTLPSPEISLVGSPISALVPHASLNWPVLGAPGSHCSSGAGAELNSLRSKVTVLRDDARLQVSQALKDNLAALDEVNSRWVRHRKVRDLVSD